MLDCDRNHGLCSLSRPAWFLAAGLVRPRGIIKSPGPIIGVSQLLGYNQRLVAPRKGLVRIAKRPQGEGCMNEACHPRILIEDGARAVWRGGVQSEPVLAMLACRSYIS